MLNKRTILLAAFVLMTTLSVFAQNGNGNAKVITPQISKMQLFNAGFLAVRPSYLLVMQRYSDKVIIKMYESSTKPGSTEKTITLSDEAGVLTPKPTAVVFTSPKTTVTLALDANWVINFTSLQPDTYTISVNGKKFVEEFVVE